MDKYLERFEDLYERPGETPWTFREPPKELVELVESGKIKPGKVLEVGCGEGYASIYLASKGFDVTAVDRSKRAINYAQKNAQEAGVSCSFLNINFENLDKIKDEFDFVFDWRFLHEIIDEKERVQYIKNIANLVKEGGKYLSVSFSQESNLFGRNKIRKMENTGILLYFASKRDFEKLFGVHFNTIEQKLIKVPEKGGEDIICNYFFMEKK